MKRFLVIAAAALPLAAAEEILIRNVTVHPVSKPEIAGGSILVRDGKIIEVGAKVTAKSAKVIDGKGLHAYPGLINSATEVGLQEISAIRETVDTGELGDFNPQLRAEIAVNPSSEHVAVTRAGGITSVIVLPGAGGGEGRRGGGGSIIAGQAGLLHLDGWTWEEMEIRKMAAIQLVFPTIRLGGGRFMGEGPAGARTPFAEAKREYDKKVRDLETFFENARRYQKAKAANEPGLRTDLKFEAMIPLLEGKVPLMVVADRERAIRDAIAFADKEKVKMVLAGVREIGKLAPELKAKNIAVILPPTLELPLNEDDPYDAPFALPGELYKAGVKIAFGSFDVQFARNIGFQAAASSGFGLPPDEALKAVTLNAAEIWGVGDQLGSIDPGKWADLILTDGDPLEARTNIKRMFIKGKEVDLTSKHTRLYDKYMARP